MGVIGEGVMRDTLSNREQSGPQDLAALAPIIAAGSVTEVMDHVERTVRSLGFERMLFALVSPQKDGNKDLYLHSTYSEDWREQYEREKLRESDLTVQHCFKSLSPLVWSSLSFESKEQRIIYDKASAFGLHTGVTLPIRGLNGELGMLTCARDMDTGEGSLRDLHHSLAQLSLLRDVASDAMLRQLEHPAAKEIPVLTARELDCLKWIAAGKTTWEIGRILNLSDAGVNFHVCNMRTKFGVNRRNDVVIKAIRLGLIDLP